MSCHLNGGSLAGREWLLLFGCLQSVRPISFTRWLILVSKGEKRISREGKVSFSEKILKNMSDTTIYTSSALFKEFHSKFSALILSKMQGKCDFFVYSTLFAY